jgi:hypothetical protein
MSYTRMAKIMLVERKRLGTPEYDLHALRYRAVKSWLRPAATTTRS